MDLKSLFRVNFAAQCIDLKNILHSWHKKFLSWPDWIHIIKNVIFPKFLLLTLPLLIVPSDFSKWHQILMDFLWSYWKHWIKISTLSRPSKVGGLGLPGLHVYHKASQLINVLKLTCPDHQKLNDWLDIEGSYTTPLTLWEPLWQKCLQQSSLDRDNTFLKTTLNIWNKWRSKLIPELSLLQLLSSN